MMTSETKDGHVYHEVRVPIKVWHDDVRQAPDGWEWARTNEQAKAFLVMESMIVTEISLDHDLGLHHIAPGTDGMENLQGRGAETGLDLAKWMVDTGHLPEKISVHSWNPSGAQAMRDYFRDSGINARCRPYNPEDYHGS